MGRRFSGPQYSKLHIWPSIAPSPEGMLMECIYPIPGIAMSVCNIFSTESTVVIGDHEFGIWDWVFGIWVDVFGICICTVNGIWIDVFGMGCISHFGCCVRMFNRMRWFPPSLH